MINSALFALLVLFFFKVQTFGKSILNYDSPALFPVVVEHDLTVLFWIQVYPGRFHCEIRAACL